MKKLYKYFFNFCPNRTRTRGFSRYTFPAHIVGFLFWYFIVFFSFSYSFIKLKAYTVCASLLRHLFLWSSGYSVKKNCLIAEEVSTMTEQVVKSKDLRRPTKGVDGRFFADCVRNIIEKAVSICVIIPQNRKVKKFQLHIIDQSFEHNGMGISYQNNWKKVVHTSCTHGVKRICQPYTKG